MFARLSIDDSMNYQKVKETILASYNLGPQAYLRNFRTMKRTGSMNYVNHLTNMKEIFCPFVEASGITDFDSLFDQMLVEQFLTSLPANVRSFVRSVVRMAVRHINFRILSVTSLRKRKLPYFTTRVLTYCDLLYSGT